METVDIEVIPQEKRREIEQDTNYALTAAQQLKVVDEETNQQASNVLSTIKQALDKLETLRKFFVDPLNNQVRRINSFFKVYSDPLTQSRLLLSGQVVTYHEKKERAYKKEVKAAANNGSVAPAPVAKTTFNEMGETTIKKIWAFEVKDITTVPHAFLIVDEVKLRAHMRDEVRAGRTPKVTGIKFFQQSSLASK